MDSVPNIHELRSEPTTPPTENILSWASNVLCALSLYENPIEMTLKDTVFIFCYERYCPAIEVKPK